MTFVSFFSQFISGISVGLVLFLIAAGLSLIFGTMRVLNLAHGTFFMVGSFLCFAFSSLFANSSGSFWWALLFAPIGVALIGGILEVLLLRRIYNQDMLYQYILTFALILILGDGLKYFFGVSFKTIEVPWPLGGSVSFWGMSFPIYNLFLIVCGIAIFIFMLALMRYTKLGRIVRAVTLNRDMANALGINVPLVYTGVFMLGCYLAGLAGALMPPMSVVALGADMHVIIECFIIVVIGGLGSLSGAFIGAVILGFLNSFGILVMPKLAVAFPFMLMIFILIVRPHGLMGKPE
ncbi:branched-chain amino acid ABC transporter permease [Desulfatitalea tepidiphila]|uniref:branched-chain amino acid ABC transporter permease n=1 Tax=Desulfatitalea tepidiphila TaxID=1185843 RepID=UPI0006B64980|nr:branched-chain amino acid ABC transporter permease [Desulfatitalea tepidiphila]